MTQITKVATIVGSKFQKPLFEDITLYRIQLRITTGVGNSAGTDNPVFVQLNNTDNKFFLRKGIDNFQEGHKDVYDVLSKKVRKVKDIQFLQFGVSGNDGVCLKKIELFFNGNPNAVFVKDYSGSGSCIDNDTASMAKTILIPGRELRESASWRYTSANKDMWLPIKIIPKEMIVSMVEATIGNQITLGSGVAWGTRGRLTDTIWGPAVEAKFVDKKTIHFDLDLQLTVTGYNPELDVDFDLEFECNNGVISMQIKNVKTGTNWVGKAEAWMASHVGEIISGIVTYAGFPEVSGAAKAGGNLLSKFLSFSLNFDPENPNTSASCKLINVTPDCDIMLF